MPSYAHLTQFSATDPLPLTLGPVVRPAPPAPVPCPLQEFERGDHGWPWSAEADPVLRTDRAPVPRGTLVSEGTSGAGKAPLDISVEVVGDTMAYRSAREQLNQLPPTTWAVPKIVRLPVGPRQQIRVAWDTSDPDDGWRDETPSLLRSLEWQAANYVGARLERRTLEA